MGFEARIDEILKLHFPGCDEVAMREPVSVGYGLGYAAGVAEAAEKRTVTEHKLATLVDGLLGLLEETGIPC